MRVIDGEAQLTGKLNNPDDSLLTEDSEACKEQKSKLNDDLISRQAAISIPILPKEERKKFKDYDDAFETGWFEALACVNMIPPTEPEPATDDCISRQEAIEEIASHDPTNGTEPYFSGHEVIDILKCVPIATHAKRTETHGVCSDCISRQAIEYHTQLEAMGNGQYDEVEVAYKSDIESLPPVEPERPKRTETMMVNGEPTEIDPLSYEVGYSHGQSERPQGEWIPVSERLPKKEEKTYWVCTDTEYQCECRWTNNRFGIGVNEWGWSIFDTPQYTKPIAWMPLPEPYREDGEE